jgi:hypothetical protein
LEIFAMKCFSRWSVVLLAAALLPAGEALARPDHPGPDSGVVVHLFGPQSVFKKIGNAAEPSHGQTAPVPAANAAAPASGSAQAAPSATAADNNTGNGDMGGLLHQMFVTGDGRPAATRLSHGRAAGQ